MKKFFPALGLALLSLSSSAIATVDLNFDAPRAYRGGKAIAHGDFNGDGKLDVVSLRADAIMLTLGTGDGWFSSSSTTIHGCGGTSSNETSKPLAADFTGDGKLDVGLLMPNASTCVPGFNSRALVVFVGSGAGTFSAPVVKPISPFFLIPDQFVAVDMNGDGMADLVCSTSFASGIDEIGVVLSSGGGNFADPVEYSVGGQPTFTLTVGDFTGDFRPDVVTARRHLNELAIFVNNGSGALGAPQSFAQYFSTGYAITAGDFNNDGKLDVGGIVQGGSTSFQVWLGNGNGTTTVGPSNSLPGVSSAGGVLPGNFNDDNDLDVMILLTGRMATLKGFGNGTFGVPNPQGVGTGKTSVGDFNNDGLDDIITSQTQTLPGSGSPIGASDDFAVVRMRPGERLGVPEIPLPQIGAAEVAVADLSNDGLKDFAITGNTFDAEIVVLLQGGPGFSKSSKYESHRLSTNLGEGGMAPRAIAAADFNNDNKFDVVVGGEGVFGGTTNVIVARNDGGGDLSLFGTMSLGAVVVKVIATDLNNDGKQDLVFSQINNGAFPAHGIVVTLGNGNGTFNAPVGYLAGVPTRGVAVEDLTGDSRPDIVAIRGANIDLFINNGSGGFSAGLSYPIPANGSDIEMADLNGDGKTDVGVTYESDVARLAVFLGNGNGTLGSPAHFATNGTWAQKLTLADIDGDGTPDFETINNGVVTFFINDGSGVPVDKSTWFTTGGLLSLTVADIDNDGKQDPITTSLVDNYLSLGYMHNLSEESTKGAAPFDFDGDGRTDIGIYRTSLGQWWIQHSLSGQTFASSFGNATDRIVPADYTGDGKSDIAVWRPSTGDWFVLRSEDSTFFGFPFGTNGDAPRPADYDNDGKADPAVLRASNGGWFIQRSTDGGTTIQQFGQPGDVPVPADYDGDGRADIAIYRSSSGQWWLNRTTEGVLAVTFGSGSDTPVQGDFTGDGKVDVAIWRQGTGQWFVLRSEDFSFFGFPFGTLDDVPAPGDYDGDGKSDATVFRPSNATWYVQRSTGGTTIQQFGASNDRPVANAYVP